MGRRIWLAKLWEWQEKRVCWLGWAVWSKEPNDAGNIVCISHLVRRSHAAEPQITGRCSPLPTSQLTLWQLPTSASIGRGHRTRTHIPLLQAW